MQEMGSLKVENCVITSRIRPTTTYEVFVCKAKKNLIMLMINDGGG